MSIRDNSQSAKSVVHISTVGMSPEPIIRGYLAHSGIDRQILLHSAESAKIAREVSQKIEDLIGKKICEMIQVDQFDMTGIVSTILGIRKNRFPKSEVFINITGGTNIMASSALVACFIIGASAYYMKQSSETRQLSLSESVIEIPVPQVPLDNLGPKQRQIIKHILSKKGRIDSTRSISSVISDSYQDISYHLKRLKSMGLVELETNGREKIVTLTKTGFLFASIA
jgi:CRISPR locus-related DNA-binding protein